MLRDRTYEGVQRILLLEMDFLLSHSYLNPEQVPDHRLLVKRA